MSALRAAGSRTTMLAAAALAAAGTLLVGVRGAAAHPGDTAITISPAEADAGATVTVLGEGFTEGSEVELVLRAADGDRSLGVTSVDDEGHFSAEVLLAEDLDTRYYELQASGPDEEAAQLVQVTADPAATEEATDGPGLLLVLLGGATVLVLVGLVVVLLRGRRTPGTRSTPTLSAARR